MYHFKHCYLTRHLHTGISPMTELNTEKMGNSVL